MKSSCKKLILYPLSSIVFSTFLLSENTAKADITISPLVIETAAKQGQAQGNITVTNGDTKSFRARVYTEPFTYDLETGFKLLDSSPFDLTPYLQIIVVSGLLRAFLPVYPMVNIGRCYSQKI
jgi:P pilus assembly chaperone PapD